METQKTADGPPRSRQRSRLPMALMLAMTTAGAVMLPSTSAFAAAPTAIAGTVVPATGNHDNNSMAGVSVLVYSRYGNTIVGSATTNAQGAFTVTGLTSSTWYDVRATGSSVGMGSIWYQGETSKSNADLVLSGSDISINLPTIPLSNNSAPTISGTARVGSTLTATNGTWAYTPYGYTYQWQRNGSNIAGAVTSSYAPTAADIGANIRVQVTALRTGATGMAQSSSVNVQAGTLTTATPTISGTAKVGSALTADAGTWGPSPLSLAYQWKVNGADVNGATSTTYTPGAGDIGKTVSVSVTGSKAGYTSQTLTSSATAAVTVGTLTAADPTVSGTVAVDSTLTADAGTWGPSPVSLAYQWNLDAAPVDGATSATYTPTTADLGKTVTVTVTGTKTGFAPESRTSEATVAIAEAALTSSVPTITGTGQVDSPLTAHAGTWGPGEVDLGYQWSVDGEVVEDETGDTFTPTGDDLGLEVTVTVTGTKPGYAQASVSSAPTVVTAADLVTQTPTITGSGKVGAALTAETERWGPGRVNLSHQWFVDGDAVEGATGETFTPTAPHVGLDVTVQVTGTRDGYTTQSTTSAPVTVTAGDLATSTPTITGSGKVDSTLTANPGEWGPEGVAFTYQWSVDGILVDGATTDTFTPAADQVDLDVVVTVTGTKDGYTSESRTSEPITVTEASITAADPSISGTARVGSTLTADAGDWVPDGVELGYQWNVAGIPVEGATGQTYVPVLADLGKQVSVTVIGSKAGYASQTRTSEATAAVVGTDLTPGVPTISGTAKVGIKLTAAAGTWGPSPVAVSYQWQRNGSPIAGATGATYTPVKADANTALTVAVTGTKAGHASTTATSAAVTVADLGDELVANQILTGDSALTSKNSQFTVGVVGGLAEKEFNGRSVWPANTASGSTLVMQPDGNLVQYSSTGSVLWAANTEGNPNAKAVVQSDGNFVVYSAAGKAVWGNNGRAEQLVTAQGSAAAVLKAGHTLATADRRAQLVMQSDGNLVLYTTSGAKWASNTEGNPNAFLVVQPDGNLVVYSAAGKALWGSASVGAGASDRVLTLGADGNLVLSQGGRTLWQSNTKL